MTLSVVCSERILESEFKHAPVEDATGNEQDVTAEQHRDHRRAEHAGPAEGAHNTDNHGLIGQGVEIGAEDGLLIQALG